MRALMFLLFLLLLGAVSCGEDPTKPKLPLTGHEIVFSSTRTNGTVDLYVINADGTGFHRITSDTLEDWQPRWSPDGTKVVFVHRYDPLGDSSNVTVMNTDGAGRVRLTRDYRDSNPSWSPDGTQIAYQRNPGQANNQLWVMNADGSSAHILIDTDSLDAVTEVTWTSQNTFLGGDWFGLVRFDADGSNRTRILDLTNADDAYPRMSSDGTKIVFRWKGPLPGGPFNIYVVNADGTNLEQLTAYEHDVSYPVWSPSGTRIAFIGGDFTVWTMNADGTNPMRVPTGSLQSGSDYLGDWK